MKVVLLNRILNVCWTAIVGLCLIGWAQSQRMAPHFVAATPERSADAAKIGMVVVPAGPFIMGARKGRPGASSWPAVEVTLKAFYIDKNEVTNADFHRFVQGNEAWQKSTVKPTLADGNYLSHFNANEPPSDRVNEPVVWVSWFAAEAYCAAQNKRLPSAAEWEKAARGTDGRTFPWGETLDGTKANFCDASCSMPHRDARFDDHFKKLAPVGSFPAGASPYGALDMAGNALEWVHDWRDNTNGYYKMMPRKDPSGPSQGTSRALKGGSWMHNEKFFGLGADEYFADPPHRTLEYIGFRCAMDARIP